MTTTPPIDGNGAPALEVQFQAMLEGINGNGVVAGFNNELELTDGAGALEIDIGTGAAIHGDQGSLHGAPTTLTHAAGDPSDPRWDIVVFDVAGGAPNIKQGTPAGNPVPPSIGTDEVLVGLVYVQATATDFGPGDIYNWRVPVAGPVVRDSGASGLDPTTVINFGPGLDTTVAGNSPIADVTPELASPLTVSGGEIDLATNAVGTGVLDESIAPVWTAQHEFDAGLDTRSDIVDGGTTIWNSSAGHVPSSQIERVLPTVTVVGGATRNTSDSNILFCQTSGGAITVELSTADTNDGNRFIIVDAESNASTNNITIDTEGTQKIDGANSITIDTDDGAAVVVCNGTDWYTAGGGSGGGGGGVTQETIAVDESGSVGSGNLGTVYLTNVPDGSTLNIQQAYLTLADGQAAPSDCDLILATLDNSGGGTSQTTLISGDGTTVYDDQTGSPLGSYSNSSGSAQTVALAVDNGNFNAGSGSSQDVAAGGIGEVV